MASDTYTLRPRASRGATGEIDYEAELNPPQLEAVQHVAGPALVVAGAGSGKTRTLIFRLARLIEIGAPPGSILLLTFTRRAAEEMLTRAARLVGAEGRRVVGGTFHSFANTTLRRYARSIGLRGSFTILDRSDSEDVLQFLRSSLGLDRTEIRFPKKATIASLFSASVNRVRSLGDLLESDAIHLAEHRDELEKLRDRYQAYKREKGLLDYDDLLVELRSLLEKHPEIAADLSARHRYVMVDEYQDTNPIQADIVDRLATTHRNVMAVGDDAQSIYSFRGADFRNMMEFPNRFEGTVVITLEQNYRSTQAILDLANAVIERARERYTKILRTEKDGGVAPVLVQAETENDQSRFVCQRILELREEGVPLDEMAVLFRSSMHSFDLEIELSRANVPFVKRGGFRFVESAHVKDVVAHLRVLVNPRDQVSWIRLLTLLAGIGPKRARAISDWLADRDAPPAGVRDYPAPASRREDLERLGAFFASAEGRAPGEIVEAAVRYYEPILQDVHRDDSPRRLRDLDQLVSIAARFRGLETLLSDLALEPPSDAVEGRLADGDDENRLTLSTIHSAKGLEWHTVFLLWAAEGRFPSFYGVRDEDDLEEERRLCYVALTRAKEQLYASYPLQYFDRGSGLIAGRPSSFLEEIDPEILAPVRLVEEDPF